MRIAVDARFFHADNTSGYRKFIKEVMLSLTRQYGEHQFIFLFDTAIDPLINLPENVTQVIITPVPANILLYKWWYDIKVPFALKKYNADVFICTNRLCSLTAAIPQVLLYYPSFFDRKNFSYPKIFTQQFLKKSAAIAAFSHFSKEEIIGRNAISEKKVTVIPIAADEAFKPLHWKEREKIKEQYAHGCEYFICSLTAEGLMNVLKAFSIFKKWQKTNMKLIITIHSSTYTDQLEKLSSYKYRNEVFLPENLSQQELVRVTGGAYAMISLSVYEGNDLFALEAMQCEIPVITSSDSNISEIAGDAALYANPDNPDEMAELMKRIFKDEQLRSKLITAGKDRVNFYNWDKTISLTWKLIEQMVYR